MYKKNTPEWRLPLSIFIPTVTQLSHHVIRVSEGVCVCVCYNEISTFAESPSESATTENGGGGDGFKA